MRRLDWPQMMHTAHFVYSCLLFYTLARFCTNMLCILYTIAHFAHSCKHVVPTASAHLHKLDATCYKLKLTKPHHCKLHLKRLDWPHPSQMMHVACCTSHHLLHRGQTLASGQAGTLIIWNIVYVHTTLIRTPVDTKWALRKTSFFNWGSSQHSDPRSWCKLNRHTLCCAQYHNSLVRALVFLQRWRTEHRSFSTPLHCVMSKDQVYSSPPTRLD